MSEKYKILGESKDVQLLLIKMHESELFNDVIETIKDKLRKARHEYMADDTKENLDKIKDITLKIKTYLNDISE